MKMKTLIRYLVLPAAFMIAACGSPDPSGSQKVAADVNGAIITVEELKQAVASYGKVNEISKQTVDDQLKVMIEQRLLIQEAMKMGLNNDPKFAETIKTFWEQTLIRNLIDAKARELSGRIFITGEEVAVEYERMRYRPKMRAVRGIRTGQEAEAIAAEMRTGKQVPGEEVIGPLFYDDMKGSPLAAAFDLKEGEMKAYSVDGEYIVVGVISRGLVPSVPPLAELEKRIKDSLLAQKKQKALAEWIASVKAISKVRINEKEIRGIANDR